MVISDLLQASTSIRKLKLCLSLQRLSWACEGAFMFKSASEYSMIQYVKAKESTEKCAGVCSQLINCPATDSTDT